jgi:hypothetical protein
MKITIDCENELDHAIQLHLDGGPAVRLYVIAAIRFFRDMYGREEAGKKVGFGEASRFTSYNTEASPKRYLVGGSAEGL